MFSRLFFSHCARGWMASLSLHVSAAAVLYVAGASLDFDPRVATQSGRASLDSMASMPREPTARQVKDDTVSLKVLGDWKAQGDEQPLASIQPHVEPMTRRASAELTVIAALAALPDLPNGEQTRFEAPPAATLVMPGPRDEQLHLEPRLEQVTQNVPRKQAKPAEVDATASVASAASVASRGADVDELPTAVFNPAPVYPRSALEARQTGRVLVRVSIDTLGRVTAAAIHRSSGVAELDESALDAVRQWRFRPAMKGGVAVRHEFAVPVKFVLAAR